MRSDGIRYCDIPPLVRAQGIVVTKPRPKCRHEAKLWWSQEVYVPILREVLTLQVSKCPTCGALKIGDNRWRIPRRAERGKATK